MRIEISKRIKKLRIIDFLFLLVIVALALFAVFYFRRETEYVYVDLTFQRQDWQINPAPPEFWAVKNIQVGDVVYNSFGSQIATVTDLQKSVWGGGARINTEVQLRVKVIYDTRMKVYVLDGTPLLIGNSMAVNLGTSKFNGQIKDIYLNPQDQYRGYTKSKAVLKVLYRQIDPWQIEALKNYVQTDSNENIIVQVKSLETRPAQVASPNSAGQMIEGKHPFKVDATLTVELPRVLCKDSACYYNSDNTFEIGSGFWADNGRTTISNASIISADVTPADW